MRQLINLLIITALICCFSLFPIGCSDINTHEKSLDKAHKLIQVINDGGLPSVERMEALTEFIETTERIFAKRESATISDEELDRSFDHEIISISKQIIINERETTVRIVRYEGPAELCGRLETIWIFIQWWDDTNVFSQTVIEGGPEFVTDFILQKAIENPVVTLVGYTGIYFPPPVFSLSFMLKNNTWGKIYIFPTRAFDLKAYWYFEQYDELILIDHAISASVHVKTREHGDGFYVYSEINPRDKLYFMFSDENLNYKLFESPHLIISSSGQTIDHINILFDVKIEISNVTIDDLSDLSLSEVVDLDPYETFESLDDSKYMIAKAAYLTKISEYRTYVDAIQKSAVLLKGAQMANEPRYQYLQAGEIHKYYNLLQANLTEQKSMIQLMLEELTNYYLNQELDDDSITYIEQFMNHGFSEEEFTLFLETNMTNEEIEVFEHSLKIFYEVLSIDAYYINDIRTGLNEQLFIIDEQQKLIKQAINELEELSF